ncbi:hypothetical protein CDCA_CDCA03G1071 [Cyanidium caldarium]|uniref:HD domain-containing protein n=1 Tax=Cyanidium caldarium TaxID=2771 RepID=A0AAV9ISL2_CYACA|nr:hypothetical protein CDCA_CDCA03G1071 [Cyanidium caldarium]|eukprot:ctg_351.g179
MDSDAGWGSSQDGVLLATQRARSDEAAAGGRRAKVFNDAVHGHVLLPAYCVEVCDTPHFQRLRDLKQLGTVYWTFPGASHNRFEHCVGTAHLAGALLANVSSRSGLLPQEPTLYEGRAELEADLKLIRLAGLCHDLGHGPFSHVFDHRVLPQRGVPESAPGRHHEERSVMLLRHLAQEHEVSVDKAELDTIGDMVLGRAPDTASPSRERPRFLYAIVNNRESGVDVDKFDYLTRDARHTIPRSAGFDYERFLQFSRVIDDELCFHAKEANTLYDMFSTRMRMHKTVYNHRAVKACECMVTDALVQADEHLGLSSSIQDMSRFLQMSDWILKRIEFATEPELASARRLVEQLRRRELYRFVDAALVPGGSRRLEAVDISTWQDDGHVQLRPDDIIVLNQVVNYGKAGGADPVERVRFFSSWHSLHTVAVRREQVSSLIPKNFEERTVMVYSRRRDDAYVNAVRQAFRRCLAKNRLRCPPSPGEPEVRPRRWPVGSDDGSSSGGGGNERGTLSRKRRAAAERREPLRDIGVD